MTMTVEEAVTILSRIDHPGSPAPGSRGPSDAWLRSAGMTREQADANLIANAEYIQELDRTSPPIYHVVLVDQGVWAFGPYDHQPTPEELEQVRQLYSGCEIVVGLLNPAPTSA